jgi:hypothetical protein
MLMHGVCSVRLAGRVALFPSEARERPDRSVLWLARHRRSAFLNGAGHCSGAKAAVPWSVCWYRIRRAFRVAGRDHRSLQLAARSPGVNSGTPGLLEWLEEPADFAGGMVGPVLLTAMVACPGSEMQQMFMRPAVVLWRSVAGTPDPARHCHPNTPSRSAWSSGRPRRSAAWPGRCSSRRRGGGCDDYRVVFQLSALGSSVLGA